MTLQRQVGWKVDFVDKDTPVLSFLVGGVEEVRLHAVFKGLYGFNGHDGISRGHFVRCPRQVCKVSSRLSLLHERTDAHAHLGQRIGYVLAGRVEKCIVKPGEEVVFLPTLRHQFRALATRSRLSNVTVWTRPAQQRGSEHRGSGQVQLASFCRCPGGG